MIQFRDDLPSLEQSDLKMVLNWLVGVVYHSFEERLIFQGMVEAKLICDFFILLTIGLHLGGFAFKVVARELDGPFSSILRIKAKKATCRLAINREAMICRLNHVVWTMQSGCIFKLSGRALDENLPHPLVSSRPHRCSQHLCLQPSFKNLKVTLCFVTELFSELID